VNAQYEPLVKPSVLTSVAVERVLLSACTKRAELDKAAGQGAVVFRHFPLSSAAASAEQAQPLIIDLYQRLLARDPSPEELNIATSFAAKFPQGEQLAIGLCVAIGSSVENVFL
jgi:hypothetical protein